MNFAVYIFLPRIFMVAKPENENAGQEDVDGSV
jgi:hypothetical protein